MPQAIVLNLAEPEVADVPLVTLKRVEVLSMEPEVVAPVEAMGAHNTVVLAGHGEVIQLAVVERKATR